MVGVAAVVAVLLIGFFWFRGPPGGGSVVYVESHVDRVREAFGFHNPAPQPEA